MHRRSVRTLVAEGHLSIGDGHRAKISELGEGGPIFLRAGALQDRGFTWEGNETFGSSAGLEAKRGRANDVVITTKGNSLGRAGYVPVDAPDFVYSPHLSRWRVESTLLNPRFLYYWVRSPDFAGQVRGLAFGTDMAPYLSLADQMRVIVPVPPRDHQDRIARVLGAIDDKIAANSKVLQASVALADAHFEHMSDAAILTSTTYNDAAVVLGGGTPKTTEADYWGGPVRWATPTDVTGLEAPYLSSTARTLTDIGLSACASQLHPAGSVLMTSRATIGAFAIAQEPMAVNQGFIVVNAVDPDLQWWLYHDMRSRVDEFVSHANGATFLELSRGNFKKLRVAVPDSEVRQKFHALVLPLHNLAAQLMRENDTLAATRDGLLPLLISGSLAVREFSEDLTEVVS